MAVEPREDASRAPKLRAIYSLPTVEPPGKNPSCRSRARGIVITRKSFDERIDAKPMHLICVDLSAEAVFLLGAGDSVNSILDVTNGQLLRIQSLYS